ncbi:hypothetical protein JG687_00013641 [Phytophthora cactorum]|uniref:RNase H type-1 domain-containing protein n=1 Tax=Phytophthora cactorum TaxID=29920 RepID=A0A8T1U1Z5_9STRA|nr:hypothetical protein JG687_00013641 [Phytophthora cactorum]
MSFACRRTTNNVAENCGLVMGLRECHQRGWTPLRVIGDSNLVIQQHKRRTPPRARHRQARYWQCRLLTDMLTVVSWTHHYGDYSTMLTNMAMDSKRSIQVSSDRLDVRWDKVHASALHDSKRSDPYDY